VRCYLVSRAQKRPHLQLRAINTLMLPMPGSPAFSWPMFRQRVGNWVDGINWPVAIAFWLFGDTVSIASISQATMSDNIFHQVSSTTFCM
jgi:hypothetical protein